MGDFTIRVYGIYIDERDRLLVSDEYIYGQYVTKLPGGGLHFGEGTIEGLKREIREECNQEAEVIDHFYTTDYFQPSAFNPEKQVLSIYYRMIFTAPLQLPVSDRKFDFPELKDEAQSFRWIPLSKLEADDFTLPIDRKVGAMLMAEFRKKFTP